MTDSILLSQLVKKLSYLHREQAYIEFQQRELEKQHREFHRQILTFENAVRIVDPDYPLGSIKKGTYRYQQSSFLQNVSKLVATILKQSGDEWQSLESITQKAVILDGENHPPTREQVLAVSNVLRGLKKRKLVELREMSLLKKRGGFQKSEWRLQML